MSNQLYGLTQTEAELHLKKYGWNELATQKRQSLWALIWELLKEPMLLLLLGSSILYFFLGNLGDALMLLFFVNVVIGITFVQERKTEKALHALKNLSSPRALAIRDGTQKRIAGREVVPGDLIILREGDRVPADAGVIQSANLQVDESLLTGESLAVSKSIWDGMQKFARPGGNNLAFVYSGTLIISGTGMAQVLSTGAYSEMGKIGKALEKISDEKTPLTLETARLIRQFSIFAVAVSLLVIGLFGIWQHQWTQGILAGLSLAMTLLPEEFSVVLLVFFSIGALRLSKVGILTRKTSAIETLGAATVLCVDKTGTITQNRMQLEQMISENKTELMEYAFLASQVDPFDPIEKEIQASTLKLIPQSAHWHNRWQLIKEYPLSQKMLALSHVWEIPGTQTCTIATKGAPEAIADLCHFSEERLRVFLKEVSQLANTGLRLIGVAKATFAKSKLPDNQHDFDFEFLGLLGFRDPLRETAPAALKDCYTAGLKVVMITGDHPGTACHVAQQMGFKNYSEFVSGTQLAAMTLPEIQEKLKTVSVFARMLPEQKMILVKALKANGEIVAMTGDGVNDAPALKEAHIGIAMGQRGTDVAREAGKLVLLDDDFSQLVAGIRMGRKIDTNLRKAVSYIIAVHVLIASTALLPVILKMPLILLPAHIAFLELMIDPACSIVFEMESAESDLMRKPPRKVSEPLLSAEVFRKSLGQGLIAAFIIAAVFLSVYQHSHDEYLMRMLTFMGLVLSNLGLIFVNLRSWGVQNKALWWVTSLAIVFLVLIVSFPPLQFLFHFIPPAP